jgi:hypothetical protein
MEPSRSCSCGCGKVRFELSAPVTVAGYCHCTRCQKRTGTAAAASARLEGELRFLSGEELLSAWRPEGGSEKWFCSACGSHLFSRNPRNHALLAIRMSAFDGDPGVRPSFRQFVNYAASWEPIPDDGLQRHGEARPR